MTAEQLARQIVHAKDSDAVTIHEYIKVIEAAKTGGNMLLLSRALLDELKAKRTTLADRVETEEPSRELDRAVEIATRGLMARQTYPPYYTTRLSAAFPLLKGWVLAHLSEIGGDGLPMAVLTDGTREVKGYCFARPTSGESALARALVAACLRAGEVKC